MTDIWATGTQLIWPQVGTATNLAPALDRGRLLADIAALGKGAEIILGGDPNQFVDALAASLQKNSFGFNVSCQAAEVRRSDDPNQDATADYYFFTLDLTVQSAPGFDQVKNKHQGPYLQSFTLTATPANPSTSVGTIDLAPKTLVGSTDYSDSISGSISGAIGMFGTDGNGTVNGQATYSHTVSRPVSDIDIVNDSPANGQVVWTGTVHVISHSAHVSGFGIDKDFPTLPDIAVHDFSQEFAWVWNYATKSRSGPSFQCAVELDLVYRYATMSLVGHEFDLHCPYSVTIPARWPPAPAT